MSEFVCERCGGKNLMNWYADNDVWNEVMRNDSTINESIVCPICFAELARKKGLAPTAWRLSKDGDDPEVDKLRVRIHELNEELMRKRDGQP